MTISAVEFDFRVNQLQYLDFADATSRLVGFIEWLETDKKASAILHELREESGVAELVTGRNYGQPPQPKSPRDVAAIGLCIIDNSKIQSTQLFMVGFSLGVAGTGNGAQSFHDETSRRYIEPLFSYLEMRLFSAEYRHPNLEALDFIPMNQKNVFVVHGRDEVCKQTVARFIEKIGLNAIILHEQSNQGKTVIEKFEHHADVGFAVIILTPDEVGRLASEPEARNTYRSRQNVIFEMGYFIGTLGRHRVFPLKKGDVEIPSDYSGVVYTELDDKGAWKVDLIRELKSAGISVDANHAFD